jgi:hypothetical protein
MRPTRLARWLVRLLPGPHAEALKGDLDEALIRHAARASSPRDAQRAHLGDVIRSVAAWWRPGAIAARRRATRRAALHQPRRSPLHLTGLGSELRQTLRGLTRRPARTALVVLTLAAGIAATTTIYTVVDAVIVRPLPYEDADRLVAVGTLFPGREFRADAPDLQWLAGTSIMNFVDWQARTRTLDALEAVEHRSFLMPDRGNGPELVSSASVTSGFLSLLDARVELGRMLQPADFETASPMVALLSHGAWLDRYGGDPGVVGRVEGDMTIVGILGADVRLPSNLRSCRNRSLFFSNYFAFLLYEKFRQTKAELTVHFCQ